MKKLTPFILLLLMSCETVSCELPFEPKKDPPPIVVTGRVVDGVAGDPIAGVTMTAISKTSNGLFGWGGSETRTEGQPSKHDGSFELRLASGRHYTIEASSPEKIVYSDDYTGPAFTKDSEPVGINGRRGLELRLQPTAWLVITPRTDRPLGPHDELSMDVNGWPVGVGYLTPPYSRLIAGEAVNIAWRVRRNGVTDSGAINLPIQRHTVMEYTFDY